MIKLHKIKLWEPKCIVKKWSKASIVIYMCVNSADDCSDIPHILIFSIIWLISHDRRKGYKKDKNIFS
jgi:hypothetical protein